MRQVITARRRCLGRKPSDTAELASERRHNPRLLSGAGTVCRQEPEQPTVCRQGPVLSPRSGHGDRITPCLQHGVPRLPSAPARRRRSSSSSDTGLSAQIAQRQTKHGLRNTAAGAHIAGGRTAPPRACVPCTARAARGALGPRADGSARVAEPAARFHMCCSCAVTRGGCPRSHRPPLRRWGRGGGHSHGASGRL